MVEATSTQAAVKLTTPAKDTRFKTTDVTNTKGMAFADFGLSKETQLVSTIFHSYFAGYL